MQELAACNKNGVTWLSFKPFSAVKPSYPIESFRNEHSTLGKTASIVRTDACVCLAYVCVYMCVCARVCACVCVRVLDCVLATLRMCKLCIGYVS